jgi:small acid-soluble spore protein H (minor)
MDISRAKEIISMEQTIDVKLDGIPVWIESVDSSANVAKVHVKNQPSNQKTVSVTQLQEV